MIDLLPHIFAADSCTKGAGRFFNFPHWYEYLDSGVDGQGNCVPVLNGINDVWLIVAAIIGILLRIGAMAAIAMVIYAGVSYVSSQGEPDKTSKAKGTLVNALLGLAISVLAAFIVTFIAESIPS